MTKAEEEYLAKREAQAEKERELYRKYWSLPIEAKKIAVCTFEGKGGFCCNPRYIVEELHRRQRDYQFVWLVNDPAKKFPSYITPIKNTAENRARELATAKIWLDNYRKPYGTLKRPGQYYLQTWHGASAFKTLGLWRGEKFSPMAYIVSKSDADMTDFVISDSEWGHTVYPKGLVYAGEYLKYGSARCDILLNEREKQRRIIREKYRLNPTAKIVMFAPTFRETSRDGVRGIFVEENSLDFSRLLLALGRRWPGEWTLFLRLHPQLASQMELYPQKSGQTDDPSIVDVSQADDMSEILAAVDVLVTDYSSAAMDAGFADIPVFLYADDIAEYTKDRGGMFWDFPVTGSYPIVSRADITPDIHAVLPYPLARDNDELAENIIAFDCEDYRQKTQDFAAAIGLINDGQAASRAASQIERWIEGAVRA